MRNFLLLFALWLLPTTALAEQYTPAETSVAGLIPLKDSGRAVHDSMPAGVL